MNERLGRLEDWFDAGVVTDFGEDYAERGYTKEADGPIVLGDWNNKTVYDPETQEHTVVDDGPERLADVLARCGYTLEWLDEWYVCVDCNKLFRGVGDSYQWVMYGYLFVEGCEPVCGECVERDPQPYIDEIADDPHRCNTILGENAFLELGYEQYNGRYENGWHPGQDDNPQGIVADLPETVESYVFDVVNNGGGASQFYTMFTLWVK